MFLIGCLFGLFVVSFFSSNSNPGGFSYLNPFWSAPQVTRPLPLDSPWLPQDRKGPLGWILANLII